MRLPLCLFILACSSSSSLALHLKGRILWNDICPGLGDLGQARVVLDDGRYRGGIVRDGGFTIPDVPMGTYVLSVVAHDHAFDQLRVDVFETDALPEIRPYVPGTPLSPPSRVNLPYPIVISARGKYDYFVPQESFNIFAMFQNPMMLMMVFTAVMVLAMPYLLKNMDPEALHDFSKRQSKITEMQNALQSGDIKSGLSAIMGGADEETRSSGSSPATRQGTPSSGGSRNRSTKNRRR